jgi:glycine C-acetyltransferase
MSKQNFFHTLQKELQRIEDAKTAKRHEKIIEGFTDDPAPRAMIGGKTYMIFNSNDYLGLRFNDELKSAEASASESFGTGPGAVRFISGTLKVHRDLEKTIAKFHGRDDAIVISSAFATNLAVLFCLIKGQAADSVVAGDTLVVSDELNHRSIIDGIRVAGLPKENKAIFKHMDASDLKRVLSENSGKFKRVVVVTDGVFSMLGEYQDLKKLRSVIDEADNNFEEGIILVVDDAHGIGAFGRSGKGAEEVSGGEADVLVGTFGKAFGADGGYVVASQLVIDYLRESAATYIYSNSISPGTAAAAKAAISLLESKEGDKLLEKSRDSVKFFKKLMNQEGFAFAADSDHPIQPVLMGDAGISKAFREALFEAGILVTSINYPVVQKGRDEIRVQISASHTRSDIEHFVKQASRIGRDLGLLK